MKRLLLITSFLSLWLAAGCGDQVLDPGGGRPQGGDTEDSAPQPDAARPPDTPDAGGSPEDDAGTRPVDAPDARAPDADADADDIDEPLPEGVEVSHAREVRGAWIATVFNLSWPSRAGLSADAQKGELRAQLDAAQRAGLNTIYFQVRAEADAFYPSTIEPWSRFLTGTMGRDPGYDPLAFAIDEAHQRGLELHAWLNPYRALASANSSLASADHILRAQPGLVLFYGDVYWMDPGLLAGQAQTLAVIHDLLARYKIDGIHFDDYFYPYPNGTPFPDSASYNDYLASGGALSLGDYRRRNVNDLIDSVHQLIRQERPDVRFGISPFGIYRPGIPPGIVGLDQYDAIYADPLRWLQEGWVDYIAPQLYWPTTQTAQAYGKLLDWWADQARAAGKDLYVGNYTSKLGEDATWTVAELLTQIRLTRAARDRGALGNIHFHIKPIVQNKSGLTTALVDEFYGTPAAPPPIAGHPGRPERPRLRVRDDGVHYAGSDEVRYFAVYRDQRLVRLVPGVQQHFGLARGEYLISVIDRLDRESLGVPVRVLVDSAPPIDEGPSRPGCTHSLGGAYAHGACSQAYQCCDGAWKSGQNQCGACTCVEPTGQQGCSP